MPAAMNAPPRQAHDGGGRGSCGCESPGPESADVNEIHRSVDGDDAENATDETAREGFLRVADLPTKEARGLPTAVGKQDGGHRRAESEREFERRWLAEEGAKGNLRRLAAEEAEKFEQADRGDGGECHGGLHAASGAYAEAVDGGEQGQGTCGQVRIPDRPMREFEKIACEDDCDGSHAAGLNHQQQHPAIEKRHARMKRFAQVSVLAAHGGQARGEFGIDEAAEKRDDTAGNPSRQDEERGVDALGDQIRIDEDSRADDAAHHGHGRAKQAEMACQAARRRGRDLSGGHRCEPALEPTCASS